MEYHEEFLGSSTGKDTFHLYLAHGWHSKRMFRQDVFSCTKSIVKSPWIQIHLISSPTDILTLITYRPFNALKSLIPSAGPQIWITSSLVSFNKSAPGINIRKWVIKAKILLVNDLKWTLLQGHLITSMLQSSSLAWHIRPSMTWPLHPLPPPFPPN